jgi:hypothetical protein
MEDDSIRPIIQEFNSLLSQQLDTLEPEKLSQLTPEQLHEYELRYARIQAICEELQAKKTAETAEHEVELMTA